MSALKENQIYLDSIQGRLDKLSATWQSLSSNLLDDELVKGFISFIDDVLGGVNAIVEQLGLIPGLIAAAGTAVAKKEGLGVFADTINPLDPKSWLGNFGFKLTDDEIAQMQQWNKTIREGNMTTEEALKQSALMSSRMQDLVDVTEPAILQGQQLGSTWRLNATGLKGMGVAAKALLGNLIKLGVQFLAIAAVVKILQVGFEHLHSWWVENVDTLKNLKTRAEESTEALKATQSEIEDINKELETTNARIKELTAQGQLNFTEQSELDLLQKQNQLLTEQLRLKTELAQEQSREANEDNIAVIERLNQQAQIEIEQYNQAKEAYEIAEAEYYAHNGSDEYEHSLEIARNKYKKATDAAKDAIDEVANYVTSIDVATLTADQLDQVNAQFKTFYDSQYRMGQLSAAEYFERLLTDEQLTEFNNKIKKFALTGATASAEIASQFAGPWLDALEQIFGDKAGEKLAEHINSFREIGDVVNHIVSNTEAYRNMEKFQKEASELGNTVDLLSRKLVSASEMQAAGWTDIPDTDIATVFSSAYSNEDATKTVLVTPILPNGEVLTPDELDYYVAKLLSGEKIDVDIQLGLFEGKDSIKQAEEFADVLHILQEELYVTNPHIPTIIEQIATTDFDINLESVTQAFGKDFISELKAAGISVDEFIKWLQSLQIEVNKISIVDTTEELKNHEEKLKTLSEAYNEFVDNAGKVSSATLDGFKETFSTLDDTEVYENFIKVIGDSSSTVAELQTALDDLVTAYFNQDGAITNLDEDTLALYVSQLKQMGVVNALALAETKLRTARLETGEATREDINYLLSHESALDDNARAALNAANSLELLAIYEEYATSNNFEEVVANHTIALGNMAKAAGQSAANLARYVEVIAKIAELEKAGIHRSTKLTKGNKKGSASLNDLYNELDDLAAAAEAEFKGFNVTDVDFKSTATGKTSSDAYNKAKARLDNQLERNLISYNQYYAKLEKLGKKYFKKGSDDMNTHLATLADVRKTAYDHYQAQLDAQLAAGKLSLSEYYSKSTALSDKWLKGRVENEKDYLDAVDSVYDQIVSRWEELISKQEEINERKTLDRTWAPGDSELKTWQKKLEQLQKDYVAGLFDNTDEYYDLYYDILKRIRDLEAEELQAQMDDLEERSEGIQDLIDMVDEMLRQRIEDQIEALENLEDKYQDIVDAKKESLDLTREELSYQRELEESNKELADLQAKAALLALDDSREGRAQYAAIMEEIRSKQLEISDSQADHTYEATTDALDEATERYQTHIQEKIDDLNEMTEHQGEWLEYVYNYIESTDPSRLFRELRDYNYEFGDGMNDTVADIKLASQDLLIAFERDVPAILEYLKSQKNTVQATIDGASGSGSGGTNLGENYTHQIDSKLNNAIQASVTKTNTDKQNRELVTQLKKDTGLNAWYDDNYKVIYIGEEGDRAVTAGAYNVIQQLKDLSENGQSREAKEKQVNTLLKKLEGKWSYRDIDLLWNADGSFHLYKTTGNNIKRQIFHNGVQQGFASDGKPLQVSSKQRELLAKLQAGEIVLNRNDQERLLVQMQVLETLHNKLKQFELDSNAGINNTSSNVIVNIEAPIVIHGKADDDTVQKLNKFRNDLKDDTLSAVTDALRSRGYNHNVKSNAQKK